MSYNLLAKTSFFGAIKDLASKLSSGSVKYGRLVEVISDLLAIDYDERGNQPLNPADELDNTIISEIMSNAGLLEDQIVTTFDGDEFSYDDLLSIITHYDGTDEWTTTLGEYVYTFDEVILALSRVHQSSSVVSYFLTNAADGVFTIEGLNTFIDRSFQQVTGETNMIVAMINDLWNNESKLASATTIIKNLSFKMTNPVVSNWTMDFDETDYTITSIWHALSWDAFTNSLSVIAGVITTIAGYAFGAVGFILSQLLSVVVSAFQIDIIKISDSDYADEFYSIPIMKGHAGVSRVNYPYLYEALLYEGSLTYDTGFGKITLWTKEDVVDGITLPVAFEIRPTTDGRIHSLISHYKVSDVPVTRGNIPGEEAAELEGFWSGVEIDTNWTPALFSDITNPTSFNQVTIRLKGSGQQDSNEVRTLWSNRLDPRPTTLVELLSKARREVPVTERYSKVEAIKASVSAMNSLATFMVLAAISCSPMSGSVMSLVESTFPFSWNYVDNEWVLLPYSFPSVVITRDDTSSAFFNALTKALFTATIITNQLITTVTYATLGDTTLTDADVDSAWTVVRTHMIEFNEMNPFNDLGVHLAVIQNGYFLKDIITENAAYPIPRQEEPKYAAATDVDYKIAAASFIALGLTTIVAISSFLTVRAWNRRRLAKSNRLDDAKIAAGKAYQANPTKSNLAAYTKATARQNRFYQRTGYLRGASMGASSADLLPSAVAAIANDTQDVAKSIAKAIDANLIE